MDALLPGPLVGDAWLAEHLGDQRLVILDATTELPSPRHDGDYRVASGRDAWHDAHIPGSRHADLTGDLSDHTAPHHFTVPAPEDLAAALTRLGVHDGTSVVVYDNGGGIWAARLWWMLRSISVPAAVLDGGWAGWLAAGHPTQSGPAAEVPAALPGLLTPVPLPGFWADITHADAVARGERPGALVCALPAAGFDGTAPTRYARRGHIPGSLSLPGRDLLDDAGRFLPRTELAARVSAVLQAQVSPVVLYCGGGISAAAVALALTLLGREDVTLYDGSLEEWAASERPLLVTARPPR
ncbi:MAG: thiosulfate/3-mercaptopyruvate sulfurtransferase [Streptomyces sp.]|jgi:thiosulfate/3-mercaptopyruvate sulfurtransferase|nr:thiosulfate/3-mercaptopyruvate sulfurtransferase [Streptomyces sp.]